MGERVILNIVNAMEDLNNENELDWFDDLTEGQQKAIDKSIEKLDNGERIPHAEVATRLRL